MPKENYKPLALAISKKSGYPATQVTELLKFTMQEISERLSAGEDVALRGFGTFVVKTAGAKAGRNPKKPEHQITIPARQVVRFRPGQELRESVAKLKVKEQ